MAPLKVYADRLSQPSRAILIFCKVNGIDFEEIAIDIFRGETKKPEYIQVNPMGQVPAISNGDFYLFESHAILVYLASVFPGIADHWYPADVMKRAKVHSVLDWHHTNLRRAAHVVRASLAPKLGFPMNSSVAAEAEQTLAKSLLMVETFWLKGDGKFLLGGSEPSIADLSLVCEIMEMEFLEEKELSRILSPHKKVLEWIEATCTATNPHFDEVHEKLLQVKAKLSKQSSEEGNGSAGSSVKALFSS
ncbi:glutathione transferase [Ranunculus cassubicifolius]